MTTHLLVSFQVIFLAGSLAGSALIILKQAVDFINCFCCNRHNDDFNLADYFPGTLDTTDTFVFIDQAISMATPRPKFHPVKECEPLRANLYAWRSCTHQNDPLRGMRQITWIFTNLEIDMISKVPRMGLANVDQLKSLLGSTLDWVSECGQKIVDEVAHLMRSSCDSSM